MSNKRLHERYPCRRTVYAVFYRAQTRCGVRRAEVVDISKGGLLLRFEEPPPTCDRVTVRTSEYELSYEIRHRFERDGSFFTGVQVIN
jgi:PilZ domain